MILLLAKGWRPKASRASLGGFSGSRELVVDAYCKKPCEVAETLRPEAGESQRILREHSLRMPLKEITAPAILVGIGS
jgi:hypothetical protein